MLRLTLLCRPPLLLMIFSIIHDAAEPQITTFKRGCCDAQVFHQWVKALRNPDRAVCIQGNSSNKTTCGWGGLRPFQECCQVNKCLAPVSRCGRGNGYLHRLLERSAKIKQLVIQAVFVCTGKFKLEMLCVIVTNQEGFTYTPPAVYGHQLRFAGMQYFRKDFLFFLPAYNGFSRYGSDIFDSL